MNKPLPSYEASSQVVETTRSLSEVKIMGALKDYITIAKMGIVFSNLITTFTGIWLALYITDQRFLTNIWTVVLTLLGSAFIIAGSASLNNFIDRDIDQLMERTVDRPSATGKLSPNQVLIAGSMMLLLGIVLLLQTTLMALLLGILGAFVYIVIYTIWLKRTHSINTIVGGISGAIPPVIGWAAIDPHFISNIPWLLFWIMFFWQPPHFLALAMKRVQEYRRAGIPMLPVVAGFAATKRQMVIYIVVLLPVSLLLYQLGTLYTLTAVVLGLGWLILSISGFFIKDDMKWSRIMFIYSLNYLMLMFIIMIVTVAT